jgi:hypothetical protein
MEWLYLGLLILVYSNYNSCTSDTLSASQAVVDTMNADSVCMLVSSWADSLLRSGQIVKFYFFESSLVASRKESTDCCGKIIGGDSLPFPVFDLRKQTGLSD